MQNPDAFTFVTAEALASATIKMTDNVLFRSATDFSQFIETEAIKQDRPCTDIILEYCDEKDIEPDAVGKLINESLKGKIELEMIESGLLEKRNTLEGF
jgi:hypothetical protein